MPSARTAPSTYSRRTAPVEPRSGTAMLRVGEHALAQIVDALKILAPRDHQLAERKRRLRASASRPSSPTSPCRPSPSRSKSEALTAPCSRIWSSSVSIARAHARCALAARCAWDNGWRACRDDRGATARSGIGAKQASCAQHSKIAPRREQFVEPARLVGPRRENRTRYGLRATTWIVSICSRRMRPMAASTDARLARARGGLRRPWAARCRLRACCSPRVRFTRLSCSHPVRMLVRLYFLRTVFRPQGGLPMSKRLTVVASPVLSGFSVRILPVWIFCRRECPEPTRPEPARPEPARPE